VSTRVPAGSDAESTLIASVVLRTNTTLPYHGMNASTASQTSAMTGVLAAWSRST
jgi:hypothetical protein